jgi:hypothetical protein
MYSAHPLKCETQNTALILRGLGEQVNYQFCNCPEAVNVFFASIKQPIVTIFKSGVSIAGAGRFVKEYCSPRNGKISPPNLEGRLKEVHSLLTLGNKSSINM